MTKKLSKKECAFCVILLFLTKFLKLPAVHNRNDSSMPLCNFHECGLGHVKMSAWWVAPPSVIRGLSPIRRTKIGSSHCSVRHIGVARTRLHTLYLITSSTCIPVVEQCRTQCRCVFPVTIYEQISVPTCPSFY